MRPDIGAALAAGLADEPRLYVGKPSHPHEICELALAHTVGSKVERAYRRSDAFERRRRLMEDWSAYCDGPRANVVAMVRK